MRFLRAKGSEDEEGPDERTSLCKLSFPDGSDRLCAPGSDVAFKRAGNSMEHAYQYEFDQK
jgi:hypothetical protein